MNRIETDGLELGHSVALASALTKVRDLSCSARTDGSTVLKWSEVFGAISYEAHTSVAPEPCEGWTFGDKVAENKWRLPTLVPAKAWVRVRALGPTGSGPWSDPLFLKDDASARMAA